MMLPLIAWMVACWIVRNVVVDISHALRGQPSPRLRYRHERWKAGQTSTGKGPARSGPWWQRGPGRNYLWGVWEDSLDAATQRRVSRRAAQAATTSTSTAVRASARTASAGAGTQRPAVAQAPQHTTGGAPATTAEDEIAFVEGERAFHTKTSSDPSGSLVPPIPTEDDMPVEAPTHWSLKDWLTRTRKVTRDKQAGLESDVAMAEANYRTAMDGIRSLEATIAALRERKVSGNAIKQLTAAMEALKAYADEMKKAIAAMNAAHHQLDGYDSNIAAAFRTVSTWDAAAEVITADHNAGNKAYMGGGADQAPLALPRRSWPTTVRPAGPTPDRLHGRCET